MVEPFIPVQLSYKGRNVMIQATLGTTAADLLTLAQTELALEADAAVKLLYKGKRISTSTITDDEESDVVIFNSIPKTTPKILVLVTQTQQVEALNAKRSDPTLRGLDQEIQRDKQQQAQKSNNPTSSSYRGTRQDKNYKFCRFEACTWQSFGHRPVDSTPHDFAARALLERLAEDPGVVAVMKTRQLIVGTLGEMDPIDDRLMHQKQQQGACLLGYNTASGQRIDIKLRTDDLRGFRPYPDLVATLLHELSHNWVGEHNLLFWTNFAQIRAEYLWYHTHLGGTMVVRGKTLVQLAELPASLKSADDVYQQVMRELVPDMAQHGLHPNLLAAGLQQHCQDLQTKAAASAARTVGGERVVGNNPRELSLAAAERRAQEQKEAEEKKRRKE